MVPQRDRSTGILRYGGLTRLSAILKFAVLAVAMGTGEFSVSTALLDLLKQVAFGLIAGLILGYLAAMLIAHEEYAFLREYAPVVSLMAASCATFQRSLADRRLMETVDRADLRARYL